MDVDHVALRMWFQCVCQTHLFHSWSNGTSEVSNIPNLCIGPICLSGGGDKNGFSRFKIPGMGTLKLDSTYPRYAEPSFKVTHGTLKLVLTYPPVR